MSKLEPRGCKKEEFSETVNLLNLVFCTSRGKPPTMLENYPHLYNEKNLKNMRILKVDGKIVAHAAIYERELITEGKKFKVGAIGGVATHPDYRGNGYASLVLRNCIYKMEKNNCDFSILWTGSPDFYRRLDWEQGGKQYSFSLNQGNYYLLPSLNIEIIENIESKKDWETIKNIHEREYLRLERSLKEYKLLFSLVGRRLFLGKAGEKILAYLLVDKEGIVLEYGGKPEAVVSSLRKMLEKKMFLQFTVFTPGIDEGISEIFQRLSIPCAEGYLGMIRIINEKKMEEKLGIRVKKIDNSKKMVKLIFGPERRNPSFFPIPIYWWRSEHM